MLSEERKNSNFLMWQKKLQENDCLSSDLIDNYGNLCKISPFSISKQYNDSTLGTFPGDLIQIILYKLCRCAIQINNNLPENIQVDKKSLLKVCLLQHISKSVLFVDAPDWQLKKGMFFTFNSDLGTSLKCGERSVLMCVQSGIIFTDEEYEGMTIIDRGEDENRTYYSSLLASIVKSANLIVNAELRAESLIISKNKENNSKEQ